MRILELPGISLRIMWMSVVICVLLTQACLAAQEVVYHNSRNSLKSFIDIRPEYGDEIFLELDEQPVVTCTIKGITVGYVGWDFDGDEQARIRFYENDGEEIFAGARQPKTVFFDSGVFDLAYSEFKRDFVIEIEMIVREAPGHFTWTIEFFNISEDEAAGLAMYNPPIVGNAFLDYWQRLDEEEWELRQVRALPTNFSAVIVAEDVVVQEDPTGDIVELQIEGRQRNLSNLSIRGPSERMYVIESSPNLIDWEVIEAYSRISPPLQLSEIDTLLAPSKFYRSSAHPALKLQFTEINATHAVMTISGAPHLAYVIEGSSDLKAWTELETITPESIPSDVELSRRRIGSFQYFRARIASLSH